MLAKNLLEQVSRDHRNYQDALDLLIQFEIEKDARGLCVLEDS